MCSCEVQAEFHDRRKQKARKPHPCFECKETIPMGASHYYFVGKWEYDFTFWRACESCEADWDLLGELWYQLLRENVCVCYGMIRDRLGEALDFGVIQEDHALILKWFNTNEGDLRPRTFHEELEAAGQLTFSLA